MLRVGLVGYGYWGPNLARNFSDLPQRYKLTAIADLSESRRANAQARYPGTRVTGDVRELIEAPDIDAVAIATPLSTHYELAKMALRAGKHVLVEKPMTSTVAEAEDLLAIAAARRLVLMVDHTFVYTGAVRKMRDLAVSGELGDLYYYDSARVNLGLFQHDTDVIWDLAVHDLSIMDFVTGMEPCAVSATGVGHVTGRAENIAYVTIFFQSNLIGHVHVNWLAPVKLRRTMLGGSRKMIVYDDLEPSEKVKVYDKGITVANRPEDVYKLLIGYRSGDMWAPQIEPLEALRTEAIEFADAIENSRPALTDGLAGLRVVRILQAATQSMKARGRLIELNTAKATA
jgi:predicted dehydrogenase